jgi:hypothetical protein
MMAGAETARRTRRRHRRLDRTSPAMAIPCEQIPL